MSTPSSFTPLLTRASHSSLLWRTGAIVAATGIIAGAFGAHGLKGKAGITADKIHAWETASHYAVFNGLALLLVSLHPRFSRHRIAGPAIAAGGLLFSGSIFSLVLGGDRFKALGPVTPLGGLIMITGYISLAF